MKKDTVGTNEKSGSVQSGKSKAVNDSKVDGTAITKPKSKALKDDKSEKMVCNEVKSKAVKDTGVNSSSESLLGNKSLSISMDRSDVDRYLSQSHEHGSEHPCVDSDSSEGIAISRKRWHALKRKPAAVKVQQKLKVPKLVEGKQLCSRVVTIKQEPTDDNDPSSRELKSTRSSSWTHPAPKCKSPTQSEKVVQKYKRQKRLKDNNAANKGNKTLDSDKNKDTDTGDKSKSSKNNGKKKHKGSKAGENEHSDEHTMYNESDHHISKKTFKCNICDKLFASKQNLRKHIDATHTVCKFTCKLCQKVYSIPQSLCGHVRSIHEGVSYKCTCQDCDKSSVCKDQLNVHILGHQGKFMYIYSVSSCGYNHKGNFEYHQNSHMEGKAHNCGKFNKWGTNYL